VSPEFDRLADQFLAEADDLANAQRLAHEIQEFLARDVPWLPLFNDSILEAYRSDRVHFSTTRGLGGLSGFSSRPGLIDSADLEQ
jgi:ABC-type transport system substrate-binding protein